MAAHFDAPTLSTSEVSTSELEWLRDPTTERVEAYVFRLSSEPVIQFELESTTIAVGKEWMHDDDRNDFTQPWFYDAGYRLVAA